MWDLISKIYVASMCVYDPIDKVWIKPTREDIINAINSGIDGGVDINRIPADGRTGAEVWKIRYDGAYCQLSRYPDGRTVWYTHNK